MIDLGKVSEATKGALGVQAPDIQTFQRES